MIRHDDIIVAIITSLLLITAIIDITPILMPQVWLRCLFIGER